LFIETVREVLHNARRPSTDAQRVLAVGAHPDDVEIGCGGILLRHRERGDRVTVLTLTGGEAGGAEAVRAMEAHLAAALLDADLELRSLKDTSVGEGSETISVISEVVRSFQPDVVYTHSFNDVHQDHRNTHRATLVATRAIPNVFCYQSPSSTTAFTPTMYVDIERTLEAKLRTIAAYASQTAKCAYLDPSLLEATARYWSRFSQARYVEALEVMRCSSYHLSLDGTHKRKTTISNSNLPSGAARGRIVAKAGLLQSMRPAALRSSRPDLAPVPAPLSLVREG
jgi:LmbE family N-acetylglucosaminyl deacetylase